MVYPTTTNKSLEKPDHGTAVDVWDVPLNSDFNIIDKSFGGVVIFNATAGSQTLTSGISDAYSYIPLTIQVEGSISANVVYTIPSGVGGQWVVRNITTDGTGGPWTVSFVNAYSGLGVVIPRGYSSIINSDGAAVNFSDTRVPAAAGSDRQVQFNSGGYLGGSSAFTYDSSGNLGIGTSSPSTYGKLSVYGSGFNGGNANFISSTSGNSITITGVNGTGINDVAFCSFTDGTNNAFIGLTGTEATAGALRFATGTSAVERMRITSGGNVGIGNTPSQKLEVSGTIYSNSGGFKFPDGSTQTTAVNKTPNTGEIGTYALLLWNGVGAPSSPYTTVNPSEVIDGANLSYANTVGQAVGSASGTTWKCMGYVNNGGGYYSTTLWLRIS